MSHARYALSDDEDESFQPTQASSSYTDRERMKSDGPAELPPWEPAAKEETQQLEDPNIIQLTHAWLNERGSPEILPWNSSLIDGITDQIAQQQSILDSLMPDASTSEEEHFRLNLVQLDVERAIWLLRSYLRARISKIEEYAAHIMAHQNEQQRLSDVELGYARRYNKLTNEHFHSAVLQFLPESMRGMDDPAPGASGRNQAGGMSKLRA